MTYELNIKAKDLNNEAAVETRFIDPLLKLLGYPDEEIRLKTSIGEFQVGKGHKSILYKPDYIITADGMPALIVDAKSPTEDISHWEHQCSSYCLELNKLYDYNPVFYFVLSNGLKTSLYQWDQKTPLITVTLSDISSKNSEWKKFCADLSKSAVNKKSRSLRVNVEKAAYEFKRKSLPDLVALFQDIHQYIWSKDKMSPSAAFGELIKIIFVKLRCDKELHDKFGKNPSPQYRDVKFSSYWVETQTESISPINSPLLSNLLESLEKDIRRGHKKRFFEQDEKINLGPDTIKWIVKELEHVDLYGMEEDVHGRMFEAFLDATARGRELGQFFTPRDIVDFMVRIADIRVTKTNVETVIDACCGSGGFLISALNDMLKKATKLTGQTTTEKKSLVEVIQRKSIFGIDAGSNPPIYRIARMNMYLHGDGGSNIFWADSLDKNISDTGNPETEHALELDELRALVKENGKKFDVILSNPPFSLKYSRDDKYQQEILNQYEMRADQDTGAQLKSMLSSVMFLERYKDLVSADGRILAIVDESILSGQSYASARNYIRKNFIIIGVISLPGDAFRRSAARVKTSILILRLKKENEEQTDVFMACSTLLGLEAKTAKRIGIPTSSLENSKLLETESLVNQYQNYLAGNDGEFVVAASEMTDRLDVKFCLKNRVETKKRKLWKKKLIDSTALGDVLSLATGRAHAVVDTESFQLLRVTYDGDVVDGELMSGDECSYGTLYKTQAWDVLYSNMGLGRGAIGIVAPYHAGKFVSNEYTILRASTHEEAVFYVNLIRTKDVLADILSATTGMNRGRIKWEVTRTIFVPSYSATFKDAKQLVKELEAYWNARVKLSAKQQEHCKNIGRTLGVDEKKAFRRWLAYKPPE